MFFFFFFFYIKLENIERVENCVVERKEKKIEVATIKKIRGKNDEKYISSVTIS